jgi:hypothetical protein
LLAAPDTTFSVTQDVQDECEQLRCNCAALVDHNILCWPLFSVMFDFPCRVFNPLRTNVNCSPELADYPLLGRALPAHRPPGGGSSSNSTTSEWCLVAQIYKHSPELLPPADDDRF